MYTQYEESNPFIVAVSRNCSKAMASSQCARGADLCEGRRLQGTLLLKQRKDANRDCIYIAPFRVGGNIVEGDLYPIITIWRGAVYFPPRAIVRSKADLGEHP